MNYKSKTEESSTAWINVEMDAHTNKLLTETSARSERTKRKEALLRLADHLERFESISHKGEASPRTKQCS